MMNKSLIRLKRFLTCSESTYQIQHSHVMHAFYLFLKGEGVRKLFSDQQNCVHTPLAFKNASQLSLSLL